MKRNLGLLILALGALAAHGGALAQVCYYDSIEATAPADRFIDNGDGTVTDEGTGLQWKRCSEGQSWNGTTCLGSVTRLSWQGALQLADAASFAGNSDWRLPNIKELASIFEQACHSPAIDLAVFPGTPWSDVLSEPSNSFWSSSPDRSDLAYTRAVHFSNGEDRGETTLYDTGPVRLVRGGGPGARINDTGIDWCSLGFVQFTVPCPVDDYPWQDGELGRDITRDNDADGHAGFSFTKLDADGDPLPANAPTWSCIQDEVTGLMWEAKTNISGLHDKIWTYSWYNPDPFTNGGTAGWPDNNDGWPEDYDNCYDPSRCDTDKFAADVNAEGLCGFSDWRLPTREELRSIVHNGRTYPSADIEFFPDIESGLFYQLYWWTSSPDATARTGGGGAWLIDFSRGADLSTSTYHDHHVRLVRVGESAVSPASRAHFVGVWRPSTGRFYLDMDGSQTWDLSIDAITDPFGIPSDRPVAGDWNGDGFDEIGVWRPSTGRFYLDIDGSFTWTAGVDVITDAFGIPTDRPVAGDWNGDGTDEIGMWRPSTGRFYLDMDGSSTWSLGVDAITDPFGIPTDYPVAGDWNGDGVDDIGVWRPSTGRFYLDIDGSFIWTPGVDAITDAFGIPTDHPVAGDWNADGTDDIGMWRPSTGRFYLDSDGSMTWTPGVDAITASYGVPTDLPIIGRW